MNTLTDLHKDGAPTWQEFTLATVGKYSPGLAVFSLSCGKEYMLRGTERHIELLWAFGRIDYDKMVRLLALVRA